jgi:hypothetical protein
MVKDVENSLKYEWLSIKDAAIRLGCTSDRIQYLLRTGELIDNGKMRNFRRVGLPIQKTDGAIKQAPPDINQLKLLKTAEEIKILRQKNEKENQQRIILWNDALRRALVKGGFMFLSECKKEKLDPAMALRLSGYLTAVFAQLPELLAAELESITD